MISKENIEANDLNQSFKERDLERDGLIPGWSEVATRFNLAKFSPGDRRIVKDYYRIQRIFARGKPIKGKRAHHGLFENQNFLAFEEREKEILNDIAHFVRGPSERRGG